MNEITLYKISVTTQNTTYTLQKTASHTNPHAHHHKKTFIQNPSIPQTEPLITKRQHTKSNTKPPSHQPADNESPQHTPIQRETTFSIFTRPNRIYSSALAKVMQLLNNTCAQQVVSVRLNPPRKGCRGLRSRVASILDHGGL